MEEQTANNSKLSDNNSANQQVSQPGSLVHLIHSSALGGPWHRCKPTDVFVPFVWLMQLTREVIEAMRDAGTAGTTIIDALTTNSATFHAKTLFAQEKYK